MYNVLPDIVGRLSVDETVDPHEYQEIMGEACRIPYRQLRGEIASADDGRNNRCHGVATLCIDRSLSPVYIFRFFDLTDSIS